MKLAGARALITGASSGIGAATATRLAELGVRPLLLGRDHTALAELARRTGGDWHAAELAAPDSAARIVDWARGRAGGVDLLVCNAGVGWAGSLADMPPPKIDELVGVNLTAHLRLTQLLLPEMHHRGSGHVVFVSSIAGCMGVGDEAVYAATKAALQVFADSVRLSVDPRRIGVSVVVPGVVDTPFFTRRGRPYDRPRPRPVPAGEVADALIGAVQRGRSEVFVPAWLRFPTRLRGLAPTLVATLQRRFG